MAEYFTRHFQYGFRYAVHLKKLCMSHEKSLKYAWEPRNDNWFCLTPSVVLKIFDHWGDVLICLLINTSAPSHWLKSVAWPVGPVLKFRDIPDWSSTVIKSKMAATTIRTRTRFRPPKIRLHCGLCLTSHYTYLESSLWHRVLFT